MTYIFGDEEIPSNKRRRGPAGGTNALGTFSSTQQTNARNSLRQFVISFTLAKESGASIAAPRDNESETD